MRAPTPGSLHAHVVARDPRIPRTVVSKAAMVRISHLVETVAEDDGAQAVLVGGFQHERWWRIAAERYATSAVETVGFAAPTLRDVGSVPDGLRFVPVPRAHPLEDEWFVVALGPTVSVVLLGLDRREVRDAGPAQAARTFDVLLSTDRGTVGSVLDRLAADAGLPIPDETRALLRGRAAPRPAGARSSVRAEFSDLLLAALLEQADQQATALQDRDERRDRAVVVIGDHERRRLAGVVHDGSLQYFLAAQQDIEELEEAERSPQVREDLRTARATLREGVQHLRAELAGMYDASVVDGLHENLQALGTRSARRGGFDVTVELEPTVPGTRDAQVVACVRELLVNAARHAAAQRVRVRVGRTGDPDEIVVVVEDDGVGTSAEVLETARTNGHLGLVLARERIERAGGTWSMTSAPGRGLAVRATIPVDPAA